jgi:hypothetical protein
METMQIRDEDDVRNVLTGLSEDELEELRMKKLDPDDAWGWFTVRPQELQSQTYIERGEFKDWYCLPRGNQWERLVHREKRGVTVHLRRLPEGKSWYTNVS